MFPNGSSCKVYFKLLRLATNEQTALQRSNRDHAQANDHKTTIKTFISVPDTIAMKTEDSSLLLYVYSTDIQKNKWNKLQQMTDCCQSNHTPLKIKKNVSQKSVPFNQLHRKPPLIYWMEISLVNKPVIINQSNLLKLWHLATSLMRIKKAHHQWNSKLTLWSNTIVWPSQRFIRLDWIHFSMASQLIYPTVRTMRDRCTGTGKQCTPASCLTNGFCGILVEDDCLMCHSITTVEINQ